MIQKAEQVLKEFEAHQGAVIKNDTLGFVQKRPGVADVTEKIHNLGVTLLLHAAHQSKFNDIYQKMEELQIQCDFDVIQETGGAFNNYGEIDNVFDEGKTVLAHKAGEVLLVDVWATWCGPCQKPMKHNQQMLQKNEGVWGERVRIVGVSVDEDKEIIKERVTSKKWEKVTHLTLLGWKNDHALIKDFKINGIPFVCLVNKWGKVNYVGHPSSINLQTKINQLLNEHQDASLKQKEVAAPVLNDDSIKEGIEKLIKVFTKQNIEKEFKDAQLACFKFKKEEKKEKGATSVKLNLTAYFVDGDHVSEQLLRKIVGDTKGVQLTIQKVKYTKLPQVENPSCSLCNTPGLKYPFYWLRWEEGEKFGCRACVQKKSEVEGHHFAYEKNSVLLRGKWERVGTKNLGKNLQPEDVKKVDSDHGFGCNGCGGGSEGVGHARYISLGCRADPNFKSGDYVDLCDACAFKLQDNNEGVINNLKPEGHEPNHPFLRILYNTQGYYEF